MDVITGQFPLVRRSVAALVVGMAWSGITLPAYADPCSASDFTVSKTTLADARETWSACNASILSEGNLAIGGGSGKDGWSKVGLKQVLLVTVEGVDFEGLPIARYAFVDEVLYAIAADLHAIPARESPFKLLTDEELAQFQKTLTRTHGKPRALMDLFGFGDKKPNVFIWNMQGNELVLTKNPVRAQLILQNKALAKKVEAYKKSECKLHRFNPNKPTPMTETCI